MIGYYIYFIVNDSQTVVNNAHNERIAEKAKTIIRGTIYANNGEKLAYTDTNSTEEDFSDDVRKYPYGKKFAQIIGYSTKGVSGLEDKCNYDLSSEGNTAVDKIVNDFSNNVAKGCNVYTTLDVKIQEQSYNSLGDNKGAVFAMDPDTGKVLAVVSKPSYNPENLDEIWEDISTDEKRTPLINRALNGLYIPGSTFKIVTTLAYMRENPDYQNFSYNCKGKVKFHNFSIDCFDGNVHGKEDLKEAFAYSCNGAFSTIGQELDVNNFVQTAQSLLFNQEIPFDNFSTDSYDFCKRGRFVLNGESTQADRAYTGMGQGETLVSPAQMAMIVSSIANEGTLMKPYIIDRVENSNSTIISENSDTAFKQLMSKSEAKQLKEYMKAVCEYGTAKIFNGSDYSVYGKTGTAELDKNNNVNSWFVGYAKKGKKKIAIAVVFENIKDGTDSAKNCAKDVFDEYFD